MARCVGRAAIFTANPRSCDKIMATPRLVPPLWYRVCWMWQRCDTDPINARCINCSLPSKRSISFRPICCCVAGMSTRVRSSHRLFSGRVRVPASMSIVHPSNSLKQLQSSFPASSFMLNYPLCSPGIEGEIHLRVRTMLSKTHCWRYGPPCATEMTLSI